MNQHTPVYSIDEFERESQFIETLVWEALALQRGTDVLFCGYGPDGRQVQRALAEGARVTVIEHRNDEINRFANLGAKLLRGSTSVIPARDASFDLAVSFHYLHEVDPFFHSQVLSELARVAKRVAVVEPAPPADPLGRRIALLYSQAKRELGQFEYYQPIEYWKKLLQGVKAEVSQHVFAFAKVPPREYLLDTIELLIDTIEIEEAPIEYIEELRQIARRSDVQLLPPPRFVLVGATVGDMVAPSFTQRKAPPPVPVAPAPIVATAPATSIVRAKGGGPRPVTAESGYEFPPIDVPAGAASPPPQPPPVPQPPPASQPAEPAFGAAPSPAQPRKTQPAPPAGETAFGAPFGVPGFGSPHPEAGAGAEPSPFGAPFALPGMEMNPFGVPPEGVPPATTWEWEPPEEPPA